MELSADLSGDSLSALADELDRMSGAVDSGARDGAVALAEDAARAAREACPSETGSLRSSIHVEVTPNGADVVATGPYAAFVEFGTGIGTPSTARADVEAMGGAGYVPNATGRGEEGWTYYKDGGFHRTHGQSGKGFMAAGAEAARSDVYDVTLRCVRGAL